MQTCSCLVHNSKTLRTKPIFFSLASAAKTDPTRTRGVRRSFAADMTRRFKSIRSDIWASIVQNDCFNLNVGKIFALSAGQIYSNVAAQKAQFDFPTSSEKVDAFMKWLDDQQKAGLLTTSTQPGRMVSAQKSWMDTYIESAYKKGILHSQLTMEKANIEFVKRSLNTSFFRPIHADRVGMLYTRAFNGLKGITNEMDKQISSILSQGIVDGWNPRILASELIDRVDKIGITRALTLARTEIIRAHAEATLNEFTEAGLEGVNVKAEWLTGGFEVCSICEELEGQIFTIEQAHGMLPRHPNCKCVWIPSIGEDIVKKEKVEEKKEKFEFKDLTEEQRIELDAKLKEDYKLFAESIPLDDKRIAALDSYISENYQDINDFLRGKASFNDKKEAKLKKTIENLENLLENAPALQEDVLVYRGLATSGDWKGLDVVGSIIKESGFMSTSIDKNISEGFSGDTLLRIKLEKGLEGGCYLDSFSFIEDTMNQSEFLLSPGKSFKVENITEKEGKKIVDLVYVK